MAFLLGCKGPDAKSQILLSYAPAPLCREEQPSCFVSQVRNDAIQPRYRCDSIIQAIKYLLSSIFLPQLYREAVMLADRDREVLTPLSNLEARCNQRKLVCCQHVPQM